ncbi:hypothetical protein B0H16DRAFT_1466043 [Mycena metata]|uniref:Uncharacterized protein n=1 Tax=Mycena metata TaxID=1033252 RepID=A0AAD7IA57_9AGAR|nr:hypothetical protein B0H16DRAFT_1466043 [Mycena metata]
MVQFTRSFFSLCLIAASIAVPTKRTVAQVEADIVSILTEVIAFNNNIIEGLVPEIPESLGTALNTGTSDVKATGTFDEADSTNILNDVQLAIAPVFNEALIRIEAIALHVGGIPGMVLLGLEALKTDTDAFTGALIAAVPADLKSQATTIQNNMDTAFTSAIAAFS